MNLFNFKGWSAVKSVPSSNYSLTVQEIHNEFFTAGDKLLIESERILNECERFDKTKALILKDLGFIATDEAKDLIAIQSKEENSKKIARLVHSYRIKYPNYKFINDEIVGKICLKYSLVCGHVSLFKGFVPKKNLLDIQEFKRQYNMPICISIGDVIIDISKWTLINCGEYFVYYDENRKHQLQQNADKHDGIHFYGTVDTEKFKGFTSRAKIAGLQICAPIKDMDTTGMSLNGYKIEKHIPDPVVLQPVEGGYLILTAWGDEASDPLVINELNN